MQTTERLHWSNSCLSELLVGLLTVFYEEKLLHGLKLTEKLSVKNGQVETPNTSFVGKPQHVLTLKMVKRPSLPSPIWQRNATPPSFSTSKQSYNQTDPCSSVTLANVTACTEQTKRCLLASTSATGLTCRTCAYNY
uniref:Uncharacterized protein n=1 Tax=Mola mola TaxID=94237 RepID=A0A3Q3XBJ3_MOLML